MRSFVKPTWGSSKLLTGLPIAELLGHLNNFRYLLIDTQLLQTERKIYHVDPNHMILSLQNIDRVCPEDGGWLYE
jgi:hypothetical protein